MPRKLCSQSAYAIADTLDQSPEVDIIVAFEPAHFLMIGRNGNLGDVWSIHDSGILRNNLLALMQALEHHL